MPALLQQFHQIRPERVGGRDIRPVDSDDDPAVAVVVQDLVRERVDHVLPRRCQSSHVVSLI